MRTYLKFHLSEYNLDGFVLSVAVFSSSYKYIFSSIISDFQVWFHGHCSIIFSKKR